MPSRNFSRLWVMTDPDRSLTTISRNEIKFGLLSDFQPTMLISL